MAYFLPLRPSCFMGPRVFNSGALNIVSNIQSASRTLGRHLKRLPLNVTAQITSRPVDCNATCNLSPSLELSAPTAFPDQNTLLCTLSYLRKRPRCLCPTSWKSHPQGLATLSMMSAPSDPGKSLSTPNTPGVRPSKPYSSPVIEKSLSNSPAAPALSYKTLPDFVPVLQRFPPTEKAVSLTLCTPTF